MRVTQNQIMRQYSDRISNVMSQMNKASKRVMTGLKYSRSYESPADVSRAARLYNQKLNGERYISNIDDTISIYDNIEGHLGDILSTMGDIAFIDVESALNDTNEDVRNVYAKTLRQAQESIIRSFNQPFNNQYIFGGSCTTEPPFSLGDDGVTLLYRGIDVTNGDPDVLKKLANESIYIDIGLGLTVDSGNEVAAGTAFNRAFSGLLAAGYGVDADGDPKNLISTLGMLANELESPDFDRDTVTRLWQKFGREQFNNVNVNIAMLGTNYNFLQSHRDRIDAGQYRLEEKIDNLIGIDPEKAITDWEYQQYVYNAVLKMGTSILSPSFIDFMK